MKVRLIPQNWQLLSLQAAASQLRAGRTVLRFQYRHPIRSLIRGLPILLFLAAMVTVLLVGNPTAATVPALRSEIRGVWLTTNDTVVLRDRSKVQTAMAKLRQLNFNTVYPVVWNAGYAMYPSRVVQQAGIQDFVYRGLEGQDILADVIAQGHRQGLLVIPWFEFGFMAPPTSELALQHPDWLTQKQDGGQTSISAAGEVVWLNPLRPDVQQFITSLVLEVMTQYDADGIQFDDHMSLPAEFGYDDYTIALYTKETKKAPPNDPRDADWIRWRADKITAFMTQLHNAVKQQKPQAIFSVSPNYYDFAYRRHLQDWLAWLRQDLLDELIVQVYRSDLSSFLEQINRPEISEAQQKIPAGIGILAGLRNNPVSMRQIQTQTRATQGRGLGVAFFYYESLWDEALEPIAERQSGFRSLFPYPALRSALPQPIANQSAANP